MPIANAKFSADWASLPINLIPNSACPFIAVLAALPPPACCAAAEDILAKMFERARTDASSDAWDDLAGAIVAEDYFDAAPAHPLAL